MEQILKILLVILRFIFIVCIFNLFTRKSRNRNNHFNQNSSFGENYENQGFESNTNYESTYKNSQSLLEGSYRVFNLPMNSSDAEVKKRYLELAKKHHPDKNQNNIEAQAEMTKINNAYEMIMNSRKRKH